MSKVESQVLLKSHDIMSYISRSTNFGQIIKNKIVVQGRIFSSAGVLLMVADILYRHYNTTVKLAGINKMHGIMTYISWCADS